LGEPRSAADSFRTDSVWTRGSGGKEDVYRPIQTVGPVGGAPKKRNERKESTARQRRGVKITRLDRDTAYGNGEVGLCITAGVSFGRQRGFDVVVPQGEGPGTGSMGEEHWSIYCCRSLEKDLDEK